MTWLHQEVACLVGLDQLPPDRDGNEAVPGDVDPPAAVPVIGVEPVVADRAGHPHLRSGPAQYERALRAQQAHPADIEQLGADERVDPRVPAIVKPGRRAVAEPLRLPRELTFEPALVPALGLLDHFERAEPAQRHPPRRAGTVHEVLQEVGRDGVDLPAALDGRAEQRDEFRNGPARPPPEASKEHPGFVRPSVESAHRLIGALWAYTPEFLIRYVPLPLGAGERAAHVGADRGDGIDGCGDVPQPYGPVAADGGDRGSVRAVRDPLDRAGVAGQRGSDLTMGPQIPQSQGLVRGAGGESRAVWAERDRVDRVRVAGQGRADLTMHSEVAKTN